MEEYKKPIIILVSLILIFLLSFVIYLYISSNKEQILDDQGVVIDEVSTEKKITEDKEGELIINELLKDDNTNGLNEQEENKRDEIINELNKPASGEEVDIEKEREKLLEMLTQ